MKKSLIAVISLGILSSSAYAGPPLVNLEGVGGIALNPLAYLAYNPDGDEGLTLGGVEISKPRIGAAYVNLNQSKIDWSTFGVATTIAKKLEVSYGREIVATGAAETIHKDNFGTKLALVSEDSELVPAVSLGLIHKITHNLSSGIEHKGTDWYLVASKNLTISTPVIVSAGLLSTKGQVNGILGFNDERKTVGFTNVDVVLGEFAVGAEYKQSPRYTSWKDSNYYNLHVAYLPNTNVTLALAYVNAGNKNSTSKLGLGSGMYISCNYAF